MGLLDPLKGALWLHKCLWAMHIQSYPESQAGLHVQPAGTGLPLHQFSAQQVLWTALTMAHFWLLQTGEFTVDQECFNPTCHLCVQDVLHNITTQSTLQYITVHMKSSKTDPFGQGINMVIGCSGTQVCGACSTWDLIQAHWANHASPTAPFFQIIEPTTLQDHYGGPHKRPVDQIRSQPFPL